MLEWFGNINNFISKKNYIFINVENICYMYLICILLYDIIYF